jgi:hypothetical protein
LSVVRHGHERVEATLEVVGPVSSADRDGGGRPRRRLSRRLFQAELRPEPGLPEAGVSSLQQMLPETRTTAVVQRDERLSNRSTAEAQQDQCVAVILQARQGGR